MATIMTTAARALIWWLFLLPHLCGGNVLWDAVHTIHHAPRTTSSTRLDGGLFSNLKKPTGSTLGVGRLRGATGGAIKRRMLSSIKLFGAAIKAAGSKVKSTAVKWKPRIVKIMRHIVLKLGDMMVLIGEASKPLFVGISMALAEHGIRILKNLMAYLAEQRDEELLPSPLIIHPRQAQHDDGPAYRSHENTPLIQPRRSPQSDRPIDGPHENAPLIQPRRAPQNNRQAYGSYESAPLIQPRRQQQERQIDRPTYDESHKDVPSTIPDDSMDSGSIVAMLQSVIDVIRQDVTLSRAMLVLVFLSFLLFSALAMLMKPASAAQSSFGREIGAIKAKRAPKAMTILLFPIKLLFHLTRLVLLPVRLLLMLSRLLWSRYTLVLAAIKLFSVDYASLPTVVVTPKGCGVEVNVTSPAIPFTSTLAVCLQPSPHVTCHFSSPSSGRSVPLDWIQAAQTMAAYVSPRYASMIDIEAWFQTLANQTVGSPQQTPGKARLN